MGFFQNVAQSSLNLCVAHKFFTKYFRFAFGLVFSTFTNVCSAHLNGKFSLIFFLRSSLWVLFDFYLFIFVFYNILSFGGTPANDFEFCSFTAFNLNKYCIRKPKHVGINVFGNTGYQPHGHWPCNFKHFFHQFSNHFSAFAGRSNSLLIDKQIGLDFKSILVHMYVFSYVHTYI